MNETNLKRLRNNAYRTIWILALIEKGHRSPTVIAEKVGCDRRLVDYYLKAVVRS